jgi:hypothetical protein
MTSTTASIPETIAPEAAAHVDKLGLRHVMNQMIDHMKQVVAGLRRIVVTYDARPYAPEDDPLVVIWGCRDDSPQDSAEDHPEREFIQWQIRTFSPDESSHFVMSTAPGDFDGR